MGSQSRHFKVPGSTVYCTVGLQQYKNTMSQSKPGKKDTGTKAEMVSTVVG